MRSSPSSSLSVRVLAAVGGGRRDAPATFADVPDDALEVVASFLSARDVVALSGVSKACLAVGRSRTVWRLQLARDFEPQTLPGVERRLASARSLRTASAAAAASSRRVSGAGAGGFRGALSASLRNVVSTGAEIARVTLDPLASYRARAAAYAAAQRDARHDEALVARAVVGRARSRPLRICLDVVGFVGGYGVQGAALAVWFVLLWLKLRGTLAGLSWGVVFAPLLAGVGCFACACCVGVGAECASYALPSHAPLSVAVAGNRYAPAWLIGYVWENIGTGFSAFARLGWLAAFCCSACVAFPLLVFLKLAGVVGATWGMTLVPLWLAFGLFCCSAQALEPLWFGGGTDSLWGIFGICVSFLWAPFLIVAALAAARLDGRGFEAAIIFAPYYFLAFFLATMGFLMLVLSVVDSDVEDRPREGLAALVICVVFLSTFPGAVVSSWHDRKFHEFHIDGLLAPLSLLFAALAVAACLAACFACRKSREHEYTDLYEWRGLCPLCVCADPGAVLEAGAPRALEHRAPAVVAPGVLVLGTGAVTQPGTAWAGTDALNALGDAQV